MTLQSRLARLERSPQTGQPVTRSKPVNWLAFAETMSSMAQIFEQELLYCQPPPNEPMDLAEFAEGMPFFMSAGKLAKHGRAYVVTAPVDDAGRPFYDWLTEAMNGA